MNSQTFGEKIKFRRKELGFSLQNVAEAIDYSSKSLSQIERNLKGAPTRIIEPLSKVLKLDFKDLMIKFISEKVFYEVKDSDYSNEVIEVVKSRLEKEGKGTQKVKKRSEILTEIKKYFVSKPVQKAWIFGSFARNGKVSYDSDVDILVRFEKDGKISLFDIIEMKNELADRTGREIDLVQEGRELNSLKDSINREKILVYER